MSVKRFQVTTARIGIAQIHIGTWEKESDCTGRSYAQNGNELIVIFLCKSECTAHWLTKSSHRGTRRPNPEQNLAFTERLEIPIPRLAHCFQLREREHGQCQGTEGWHRHPTSSTTSSPWSCWGPSRSGERYRW